MTFIVNVIISFPGQIEASLSQFHELECCVIEVFGGVFVLSCSFQIFLWMKELLSYPSKTTVLITN